VTRRDGELLAFDEACRARGARLVAGVDEAGRGCWAGPVVAAAVVLPAGWCPAALDDSKQLTPARREALFVEIRREALSWAACAVGPREIDRANILRATLQAMARAVVRLRPAPDLVLVDGLQTPPVACEAVAVVKGDATSAAIAAASIVAKVLRDRVMTAWDRRYPGYGFAAHKGYGAAVHREAIARLGPCPLHRMSYRPLAAHAQGELWNENC
jgi:ribonuclease HII